MPTVLIVDDDNAFRKELRKLFDDGSGFDACVEAENGAAAMDQIKRLLPNLAVVGFFLPDTSGLELAQKLKGIIPGLPIFLLAPDYSVNIEKNALIGGITAVFSKHDDLATLVANARAVCGLQ